MRRSILDLAPFGAYCRNKFRRWIVRDIAECGDPEVAYAVGIFAREVMFPMDAIVRLSVAV